MVSKSPHGANKTAHPLSSRWRRKQCLSGQRADDEWRRRAGRNFATLGDI